MAKPLGFKDFITVDYRPGEDDQLKYKAQKRKKDLDRGLNDDCWSGYKRVGMKKKGGKMVPNCVPEDQQPTQEKLSLASRRALARAMKRNKAKIKMGRRRAMQRVATPDVLMKRAKKHARNIMFKKIAKKHRGEVTPARKAAIEDRLNKMKGRIDKMARKMIPQIRKIEKERRSGGSDK